MSTSSFSFSTLYASTEGSTEHWGHIECHCGHHHDEGVEDARTGGYIHMNGACFWTCCHANWDDFVCKAPVSVSKKSSGFVDVKDEPKKTDEKEKFRRFLPTFFTQELICLSCFKPYRNPLKLSCGHSFCRECIEKLVVYQKAAGSFSSRFRPPLPESQSEAKSAKVVVDSNLRLRQMSRSQRHALLDGDKEDDSKMTDEGEVNKDFVMCPVCSVCSYLRYAVEDTEILEKMKELCEQRHKGVRPKCSFCTSAVLAGAQAGEAAEATLVCATCGPICARHHALLHIAGPPSFRCHQVSETQMELIPLTLIPRSYEICPKHGCEMDLYDKARDASVCELCVAALGKREVSTRIIRDEDKMAYLMEKEAEKQAKKAKQADDEAKKKKSQEELDAERKRNEIKQIEELHGELAGEMKKCSETLDKSQSLFSAGAFTKDVKGLAEMREEIKKIFADGHKALEEMQKQAEEGITNVIDSADALLNSRYEACRVLLDGAADASAKAVSVPLETPEVRLMVIKRLRQLQDQLKSIESLPVEPLEASSLITLEKPDSIEKLSLVRVHQNDKGLFSVAKRARTEADEKPEEPAAAAESDDEDAILDRIRAKIREEYKKDSSRRNRENSRFSTIRSAVNSGMSDAMKSEAIGAVLFERAMEVLSVDFDAVFTISAKFFEKNSVDHIMSSLSNPADFNAELRAIYELLKETKQL